MKSRTTPDSVSKALEDLIAEMNEAAAEGKPFHHSFDSATAMKLDKIYELCHIFIETKDRMSNEEEF